RAVAVVARLDAGLHVPVSAVRLQADAQACIGVVHVRVVALLARVDLAVAAGVERAAGGAARAAVAAFDAYVKEAVSAAREHAPGQTGIGRDGVAVIALLAGVEVPIAADRAGRDGLEQQRSAAT